MIKLNFASISFAKAFCGPKTRCLQNRTNERAWLTNGRWGKPNWYKTNRKTILYKPSSKISFDQVLEWSENDAEIIFLPMTHTYVSRLNQVGQEIESTLVLKIWNTGYIISLIWPESIKPKLIKITHWCKFSVSSYVRKPLNYFVTILLFLGDRMMLFLNAFNSVEVPTTFFIGIILEEIQWF